MQTADPQEALSNRCPACSSKGKPVKPVTIESLVVQEVRARAGRADGFCFCAEPTCEVAYFHPHTGARIAKSEVRVRIGQKETSAPRPICYCFDHTVEAIEAEVRATGTSKVADEISEKCRRGLDRCEETNPQGFCCLGNVRRAIKDAERRQGKETLTQVDAGSKVEVESCCVVDTRPVTAAAHSRNRSLWATSGAVVSALLSSACCWLPLLLIAFGASAAGVAAFFEAYRPYFLGSTGLLLSGGFYLVYFRKEQCSPGEACAIPNRRLRRLNTRVLWVATILVLAFALFPTYVGYLFGGSNPPRAAGAPGDESHRIVRFAVSGMTCAGCATGLQARLARLPGVEAATVDYDAAIATVTLGPQGSIANVLTAVAEQGFEAKEIPDNGLRR